jgi:hypothetical protein
MWYKKVVENFPINGNKDGIMLIYCVIYAINGIVFLGLTLSTLVSKIPTSTIRSSQCSTRIMFTP